MNKIKSLFTKTNIFLATLLVAIICFEQNKVWVEKYYYSILYPFTSNVQRLIFKHISFSVGDVLYIILAFFILYKIVKNVKYFIQSSNKLLLIKTLFLLAIIWIVVVFIIFKLLWAINYNRLGVAQQFNLQKTLYNKQELENFIEELIIETNYLRKQIPDTSLPNLNIDSIFIATQHSYNNATIYYPFLQVKNFTIKKSIFSNAGNYLGFTGYYNPFTGEAQIRSDIPKILLPFICCHEVAHQIGYASEEEANFIACIVANESKHIAFKYSMNLELLDDALQELMILYINESNVALYIAKRFALTDCMSLQVKKDRKEIRNFFMKNRKDVSNISNIVYDKYLKLNHQQKGIESYNQVISWIIEYRKLRNKY